MQFKDNNIVKYYLDTVCSHIGFKKIHNTIKVELLNHIEELVIQFTEQGMEKQEAVQLALKHLGDANDIGKQLHIIHKPKINWPIIAITTSFILLGLFSIYSIIEQGLVAHSNSIFYRGIINVLLGLSIAIGVYFFDYQNLKKYSYHIYISALIIWIYMLLFSSYSSGGIPYLYLGFFTINFVSITPFLLIISLAGIIADLKFNSILNYVKAFLLLIIPLILYFLTPSLSSAIIYILVFSLLSYIRGVKPKHIFIVAFLFFVSIFVIIFTYAPLRLKTLLAFMSPSSDPSGYGYIYIQLNNLLHEAGLMGQGFNFPNNITPEIHTDFIFTYIVYTFGWLSGLVLILAVGYLLFRIGQSISEVKDLYAKLLASALTFLLMIQFVWNIMMNLGFAPLAGIGFPFISYGGSQFLMQMLSLGLILGIYRLKNVTNIQMN